MPYVTPALQRASAHPLPFTHLPSTLKAAMICDKLIFIKHITERPLNVFGQGKQRLDYSNNWNLGGIYVLYSRLYPSEGMSHHSQ